MAELWLTDEQFAKIAPHLPTDTRGKERVDDRRMISGIIHVLKSGGRWADAPREPPHLPVADPDPTKKCRREMVQTVILLARPVAP